MRMETWEERKNWPRKNPRKNPRKDSRKKLFLILPMTALLAELEWKHFILFKILSVTVIAC